MRSEKLNFGTIDGLTVYQYILENDAGMIVKIINYGATITSVSIPSGNEERLDLVCGFDSLEGYFSQEYISNAPYFGCTVGRYAGRIKDGRFSVGGSEYKVVQNNGSNHLHGGTTGFDKKIWNGELVERGGSMGVNLKLQSPHMEEGYPGDLGVSVCFWLTADNRIEIEYEAETYRETPLSLTNHTYFNLNAFSDNIKKHIAQIHSGRYQKPDETNVPVGEEQAVDGMAADLRQGAELATVFKELTTGFEHFYIFDKEPAAFEKVAKFMDPESGRSLEVYTSEPGMLFYTGFYTSDNLKRESGERYGQFRAFCCETGRYHNGPNIPSPSSTLAPGVKFKSKTAFAFNW